MKDGPIQPDYGKRARKITEKSIASEMAMIGKNIHNDSVHKMVFENMIKKPPAALHISFNNDNMHNSVPAFNQNHHTSNKYLPSKPQELISKHE